MTIAGDGPDRGAIEAQADRLGIGQSVKILGYQSQEQVRQLLQQTDVFAMAIELGGDNIRANAIAPGAVGGQRIENVLTGRAKAAGTSLDEARASMLAIQSIKQFVDPKDIAALCVYLASDAGKSISGQVIPIGNDAHQAS